MASASVEEIEQYNILQATFLAMRRAVEGLSCVPDLALIDGNRLPVGLTVPARTIVKGDGRFGNIAAASILAKTHRDEYMRNLHEQYPQYGWNVNKGYPTRAHRAAIAEYGPTPYHRMTFRLLDPQQLTLF